MLSVEVRINGEMIVHIYGHNEGPLGEYHKYTYQVYKVDTTEVFKGETLHKREDGLLKLVELILGSVNCKGGSHGETD